MSSQKGRDLAQELVDFLLKEDQQKGEPSRSGDDKKPKLSKAASAAAAAPTSMEPPPLPEVPPVPPKKESQPIPSAPTEEFKSLVIDAGSLAFDQDSGTNADTKALTRATTKSEEKSNVIEFTALSKVSDAPEIVQPVNFIAPSEKAKEILQRDPRNEATKTEDFHFQPTGQHGMLTQRSKVVTNEVSSLMAGAEAIKVAQARINVLEKERDILRDESEQLLTASEALQRRLLELKTQLETLERKHKEKIEILEDEKAVLSGRLSAREKELDTYKKENEELKLRFQTDLRKIRVRERELEARQEILKAEHVSVMKVKDETILELKRQTEKLQFELDNFRVQTSQLNGTINELHEKNLRTVKALRLALSVLETGDSDDKTKKVGA